MYHPGLHHLAQVVLDIPVLLAQSFIFGTITYWMYGLNADAGKYFTYIFLLTLHALLTNSIVRYVLLFLGVHCTDSCLADCWEMCLNLST